MGDDVMLNFNSNSSNQSDQSSKMAKLEARLVGKAPSAVASQQPIQAQLNSWSTSTPDKFGVYQDSVSDYLLDSDDSDDDDNGGAFLVIANTQKRRKVQKDFHDIFVEHAEGGMDNEHQAAADARQKMIETVDSNKAGADVNKQGRVKGNSTSGRGRGSRIKDQGRNQVISPTIDQVTKTYHRESFFMEHGQKGQFSTEDEAASLRFKVSALEEEVKKLHEAASCYRNQCECLEKELKDFKDYEQQMKPKRVKVLSDLLISVSKAERQEARMRARQDSLRLGNVGVIRAGTVISEAWEDGQALKDLNAQLRSLLETKEAIERQRKSLKKRQSGSWYGEEDWRRT